MCRRPRRTRRYRDPNVNLRAREWQIVRAYAAYCTMAWDLLKSLSREEQRQYQVLIMLRAMEHATFADSNDRYFCPRTGFMKKNGQIMKNAEKKAKYFIDMPRAQRALDEIFAANNFGLDRCAEQIADIALDKTQSAADRLRAIDMRIRMTVGYAPTKSAALHAHTSVDGFFDEKDFENAPPVTIESLP